MVLRLSRKEGLSASSLVYNLASIITRKKPSFMSPGARRGILCSHYLLLLSSSHCIILPFLIWHFSLLQKPTYNVKRWTTAFWVAFSMTLPVITHQHLDEPAQQHLPTPHVHPPRRDIIKGKEGDWKTKQFGAAESIYQNLTKFWHFLGKKNATGKTKNIGKQNILSYICLEEVHSLLRSKSSYIKLGRTL